MRPIPPILVIGTFVVTVGNVLNIVGISTLYWRSGPADALFKSHRGLFELCVGDKCWSYKNASVELEAVRAMVLIGLILGVLAGGFVVFFILLRAMSKNASPLMIRISFAVSILAAVCTAIGLIVYTTKIDGGKEDVDYSFHLCIAGAVVLLIGGLLVFVGGKAVEA